MEKYSSTVVMKFVLLCFITTLPALSHSRCFDHDEEKLVEKLPQMAAMPLAHGGGELHESSPEEVEEWFQEHPWNEKPKLTKLHFYVHDNVTAQNPTTVLIAPANTSPASTIFGATYVMDSPITISPDPSSKVIGRAQGVFISVSQTDRPVLAMVVTMTFTEGKYRASSLSILGRNAITLTYREMPILGGTGIFRLARGTATVNTVTVDIAKLNDILEYHVIIQHY